MRVGWTLVVAALLLPANALAERVDRVVVVGEERPDGLVLARQAMPATATTGLAQSRLVYLNKGAVTIAPGGNDSRTNHSAIASQPVTLGGWNPDAALWNDTVQCIEDVFAPFEITFTQTDPGNVPHIEAVFGGKPVLFGLSNNIAGVSPFTRDCSVIESSIVFTFVEVIPQNARIICEIQAQEIAHSFGLDHVMLPSDLMSYLPFDGDRGFRDQVSACGEYEARACGLDGSVCRRGQNSVSLLNERLGVKDDPTPPTVGFATPPDGSVVPPGFRVAVTATDNIIVRGAKFYVDDLLVGEALSEPYELVMPGDLAEGTRTVRVEVTDGKQTTTEQITVTVQLGAPDPGADVSGDVLGGCSTSQGGASAFGALLVVGFAAGFGVQRRRAHR